jgi:hypothetical protein
MTDIIPTEVMKQAIDIIDLKVELSEVTKNTKEKRLDFKELKEDVLKWLIESKTPGIRGVNEEWDIIIGKPKKTLPKIDKAFLDQCVDEFKEKYKGKEMDYYAFNDYVEAERIKYAEETPQLSIKKIKKEKPVKEKQTKRKRENNEKKETTKKRKDVNF